MSAPAGDVVIEDDVVVQLLDRIRHAETFVAAALQAVRDARKLLGDEDED